MLIYIEVGPVIVASSRTMLAALQPGTGSPTMAVLDTVQAHISRWLAYSWLLHCSCTCSIAMKLPPQTC